ncbi:MAG: hypothetical protein KKB21_00955 [Nanoarchaeota archaeon]|nr:hypothetical protein [Nanoarchaeota archaeon]MBU4086124.1 hypothetical protein [Nanoarchaeota archaeon]
MNEEDYVDKLKELLIKSINKQATGKEIDMAFSGGLDSSVLAKLLVDLGYKVRGYVAGTKNSKDITQAKKAAGELGIELEIIELSDKEIEEAIGIQGRIIQKVYNKIESEKKINNDNLTCNAIPISFNLPLYFVAKNSREKQVFVSQGPDEMLGGYKRHQKMNEKEAVNEMRKNTEDFIEYGVRQNLETAKLFGKEFIMPYLDKEVGDFCLSLPYEMRIKKLLKNSASNFSLSKSDTSSRKGLHPDLEIQKHRKYILRKLALKLGISREIAFREKKSAQYGSGILDVMKKLARKQGHHISWLVSKRVAEN